MGVALFVLGVAVGAQSWIPAGLAGIACIAIWREERGLPLWPRRKGNPNG